MGGAFASNRVQKGQVFTCLKGSGFGSAPFLFIYLLIVIYYGKQKLFC